MSRLIDADMLRARMYHDAFETDTDMQKWDSGCWIRYKMFENAIDEQPTIDAVEVVRCKDCKCLRFYEDGTWWCEQTEREIINPNWFCADGERKET